MLPVGDCNPPAWTQHKLASLYRLMLSILQNRVHLIATGDGETSVISHHKSHCPNLEHFKPHFLTQDLHQCKFLSLSAYWIFQILLACTGWKEFLLRQWQVSACKIDRLLEMQSIVCQGNRIFFLDSINEYIRKCGYQQAVYDQKYFLIP